MITKHPSSTKTFETTISNLHTVLLDIPKEVSFLPIHGSIPIISRNLKLLNGHEATSFLLLLDQKLKKIPIDISADEHVVAITSSKMDCLNRFAPEKKLTLQNNSNQWMANKIRESKEEAQPLVPELNQQSNFFQT